MCWLLTAFCEGDVLRAENLHRVCVLSVCPVQAEARRYLADSSAWHSDFVFKRLSITYYVWHTYYYICFCEYCQQYWSTGWNHTVTGDDSIKLRNRYNTLIRTLFHDVFFVGRVLLRIPSIKPITPSQPRMLWYKIWRTLPAKTMIFESLLQKKKTEFEEEPKWHVNKILRMSPVFNIRRKTLLPNSRDS